jgi:putative glutamine amidotransferase
VSRSPLIGITGYHVRGEEGYGGNFRGVPGQGFSAVGHDYIQAVIRTGGVPIGLPVGTPNSCRQVVEALDGLIFSGGEDLDPTLYGAHPDLRSWNLAPERDQYEMDLFAEAIQQKKPVLAVCRGMQLANVYFGGSLYLDISDYSDEVLCHHFSKAPRWYTAHKVKLLAPVLKELYEAEEIKTNSYHHQAIKDLGKGLHIAALAEDGIIEGLIHQDHPNFLAIQWHPEMMAAKLEEGLIPFRWLVETIGKK